PEHREHQRQQNPIIEKEAAFARDHGIKLVLAFQVVQAQEKQGDGKEQNDGEENGEERADVGLRESVHGRNNPAARQKCAEDAQEERQDDQRDVPNFQHSALFLDHHRVQEG